MSKRKRVFHRKSQAELETENRVLRSANQATGSWGALTTLIKWAGVVWCFYFASVIAKAVAGKRTIVEANAGFTGSFAIHLLTDFLPFFIAAASLLYGLGERKLRQSTVQRLQSRIHELEIYVDKRRTSSHLTTKGDTRPEDR